MRKLLGTIILGIILLSCGKDSNDEVLPVEYRELSFSIMPVTAGGDMKDWECQQGEADYLQVVLNDQEYYLNVFRLNGFLYSEPIRDKLETGNDSVLCRISRFILWSAGREPEAILPGSDDTALMGTPDQGSFYSQYVVNPLTYMVMIPIMEHFSIPMEVICFQPDTSAIYLSR